MSKCSAERRRSQKEIERKQKMQDLEKKGLVYYTKYLGGLIAIGYNVST